MSDDSTRVMTPQGAATAAQDRTMVVPGGGIPQPAAGMGDALRTQMGGTTTCPVCKSTTPLMETYCGECGYLLSSAPAENLEVPVEETPAAELVDAKDGRRYRLHAGVNTIGRQGTDVLVTDGTVSRVHARITIEGDAITVEDLGSTNGTKVGDRRIGPNQPTPATSAMPLKFGNWLVTLEMGTSSGAAGSAAPAEATVAMPGGSGAAGIGDQTLVGVPTGATQYAAVGDEPAAVIASAVALLKKVEGPGEDIAITEGSVTVGRRPGNSVLLTGDPYISGRHAEFMTDNTGTYLTDLGSTNGTLVNGQKLVPQERQLLLEGDAVQLGQTRYLFNLIEEAPEMESTTSTTPENESEMQQTSEIDDL